MLIAKESLSVQIGVGIRSVRKTRGITIEQLAMLAEMEYAQLSKIELGKINTSAYQLYKIFVALNLSSDELYDLFRSPATL